MSMYSYEIICVEVDLEKGLQEAINISLDGWTHVQQLDYEQIHLSENLSTSLDILQEIFPKIDRGILL
jgi:hypothetical protein